MPQPTANDVHVDQFLTNFVMRYTNQNYIAMDVLSHLKVNKRSDKFAKFLKGAWFRDEAGIRAPGTESRGGGFPVSNDTYFCDEWAWHDDIPDEVRENADAPLKPDQDATEFCINKILLRLERLAASLVMTAANWETGHTQDAEGGWTAGASSTFITDMEYAIDYVLSATGYRPNVLVLDHTTYSKIRQDDDVLDKIKYTQRGVVTADMIASMFDLDRVLVGSAVYNSDSEAADGSDFTAANIWETNSGQGSAVLLYAPRTVSLKEPTAGAFFQWIRASIAEAYKGAQANGNPVGVRKWREKSIHSDRVEAFMDVDAKLTGNDLGFLFYDTHTT